MSIKQAIEAEATMDDPNMHAYGDHYQDFVADILLDVCELEPANSELTDTLCVSVEDLTIILNRHLAALRSMPAEPVGWQPISTAPKDATVVLLCRDDRVTAGHWEPERWPTAAEHHSTTGEYLGQFETGECVEAWWYSEDGGFCEETPPTHWMPLPAPHKEQK